MMKLGDAIEHNPIVHAVGKATGCVDPATNRLRPDSGCARRRNALNDLSDAFFDAFWPDNKNNQKEN